MADLNVEELARAIAAAVVALNDKARNEAEAAKAVDAYAAAHKQAQDENEAANKKLKATLETLTMSIGASGVAYGKAMMRGGEGLEKYSGAVQGAADAAGNAAASMLVAFGPLGIIVGGVVKAFGMLVGASLKHNDTLMKSYRELSEVGSVSGSLEKLQSDFNKVGLTTEDAAKFGSMLKKVSPDLGAFGGSVTAGKDKLVGIMQGLIGPNNQVEIAMGRIGYGAEEMRDATADYVAKQTRMGLAQGKTTEQLRTESVKYMVSLRELGELTGMSRDEAQKLMDEQQADARWAMTLKRIEAEEGTVAAEKARNYMALYSSEFGKQSATDLMEQIANKGAVVGEASARAQQSSNGQAMENFRGVISGAVQPIQGIIGTANAMDKNMKVLDGTIMVAGKGVDNLTGGYQQMSGVMKNAGRTQEDVAARIKADQEKEGGLLNKNLTLEQQTRQARVMADKALTDVAGASITVFQKLNDVVFGLGKAMAKFVDGLTATGMFGSTATNWSESFRDLGDNAADMKTAAKEKASLVAEIETSKKEIAAAEAAAANSTQNADDLKTQMRAKEKLITDMQTDARKIQDIGLRKEAEAAIAKEKFALKELNQQAFAASRGGKLDSSGITEEKKKMLLEKQQRLAIEDEKIQKLEKEKLKLGYMTGGEAGKAATGAGGAASSAGTSTAGGGRGGVGGPTAEQMATSASADKVLAFTGASGSKSNFEGLDQSIQDKVVAAGAEFNEASGGKDKLKINSAKRDSADQVRLYQETVDAGRPGVGPTGMLVAKPGTSKHEHGLAVDIQNYKDPKALAALNKQGLVRPYPDKDPVHFEVPKARDGGAFSGPGSGYPVELHGKNESVWPEEKLKATLAEVQKSSIEDYKKELLGNMSIGASATTSASTAPGGDSDSMSKMMEMMVAKFDDMIAQLDTSNSTLNNLLTYAKA